MKKISSVLQILGGVIATPMFATVLNYDNSNAFETIAAFLSITIGFSITALSIIATSSFSKRLYEMEDETDNSKTLLHNLVGKFKSTTVIFAITIGLVLTYDFLPKNPLHSFVFKGYTISLNDCVKSVVWYMTIISFLQFLNLFFLFSRFIIKSISGDNQQS